MKGKDEQTKWGGHRASPDRTYPKILFKMLHVCNSHTERINFQKCPNTLQLPKGHWSLLRSIWVIRVCLCPVHSRLPLRQCSRSTRGEFSQCTLISCLRAWQELPTLLSHCLSLEPMPETQRTFSPCIWVVLSVPALDVESLRSGVLSSLGAHGAHHAQQASVSGGGAWRRKQADKPLCSTPFKRRSHNKNTGNIPSYIRTPDFKMLFLLNLF